jgi:PAS domain S-box-containing protein
MEKPPPLHIEIDQSALFEWIINSTEEAVISKDLNGTILTWNKAAEKIFGYTKDEIISQNISILFPDDLQLEESKLIEKVLSDQVVDHYETRRVKKDGSIIDVSLTLSPIKDISGEIIGVSKILRNITEKVKASKELEESEKKYRNLFDSNPMPMFLLKLPSLQFLDVNNTAVEHYGYSREEFLNMNAFDIRPEEEKERLSHVAAPKANQILNLGTWKHILKNGTIIHVEISTQNIVYNGINSRLVICNDVTEKVKREHKIKELNQTISDSEKKFRSIIEHNKDIIILMNEKFEVTYRSPSAIAITGYTLKEIEERIRKKEVMNQVHPDDQTQVSNVIQKVLDVDGSPIPLSFRSKHKDGHYVWLEGTITNHFSDPILKSIVQNLQDVTEKKYSELLLFNSLEQLKKLTEKIPLVVLKMETDTNRNIKYLFVSKSIQNIFSNSLPEDFLNNSDLLTEHILEEDKNKFYENYNYCLLNLCDLNFEFRIKINEEIKWVKLFYHPEIKEDNTIKWYGYLEDINLQKRFLLELESQNQQLKEIAWIQSHKVRAPLSRLIGLVHLLQRDVLSKEEQKQYLNHINNSAVELDEIIKEITYKTIRKIVQ